MLELWKHAFALHAQFMMQAHIVAVTKLIKFRRQFQCFKNFIKFFNIQQQEKENRRIKTTMFYNVIIISHKRIQIYISKLISFKQFL